MSIAEVSEQKAATTELDDHDDDPAKMNFVFI